MPGPGFPSTYMSGNFVFSDLRREVNVWIVDISGIVDRVSFIDVREHRRANQKRTIQRNW